MKPCIYIALDGLRKAAALSLIKKLSTSKNVGLIAGYKIHDLWDSYGHGIVKELKAVGAREVWVDIKLNDTPKTIGLRTTAVSASGADIISVHAASGLSGLRAAVKKKIKVVAITVLTSLGHSEVRGVFSSPTRVTVLRLARIAHKARVWGIVCSAEEIKELSRTKNLKANYIVPGIRPHSTKGENQKRIGNPGKTIRDGARYIVIGSLVTSAPNPKEAFERVAEEILRNQP
jgi:orotidine-5'-phosphate decarboxylase